MKAVILLAALALGGCASTGHTVYEAAVGANVSKAMPWSKGQDGGVRGGTDVAQFSVRHEGRSGVFVEFRHLSHISSGWPINDDPEDWADMVSVGYRFTVGN